MTSTPTSISDLLSVIASRGSQVDEYLRSNNLPQPSFEAHGPAPDILPSGNSGLLKARTEVIDAARRLADLLSGPKNLLFELSMIGHHNSGVLRAVYRLGIVQNVPLEGSISYLELSKRVNADIDRLRRVVQYAMTMRLFQELTPGHVSHSAITYMVAKEPVAHSWIGNNMEVIFPSSPFLADTLVDSADESGSPRTGPQLAFGFDGPFFGYLREKPGATKLFAEAMEFVSQPGGIGNAEFLVNAPVWRTLHDKAKIVDVGGGKGFVSVDILRRYATFTGVVQDLEEVVSQCTAPTDLIEKLSFQTANFLDPQPIQDADAYLLRRVLHDWSDQDCKRILQNIIPSMKTGSRLILSEFVVPEPGMMTSYEEKMMRTADMQMMLLLGGKERGFGEWKRIFEDVAEDKLNLEMVDSRIMVWQKV